jgi:regulator of replication initiation timing
MTLPAHEAEALAYAEGFTGTARLFARVADLQKALGEAVAENEILRESLRDLERERLRE